jgi:LAO/AO transport system kinase
MNDVSPPDITALAAQIAAGDRPALARGITLVESRHKDHRPPAADLIETLLPKSGNAIRIGMTGTPGVGKSTLIDAFGCNLTAAGHKVAVLAVDPSSARTGGSILGDKTRMARLSQDANAFIRPSPSAGTLGGVAASTREAMVLCEAAGFDVIIVETVGIGQSETTVSDMVDIFVALMLPGAGDELQGLKKGVLEIADIIAVNKAEGGNRERAGAAAAEYSAALKILSPHADGWSVPVLLVSGLANEGLDTLWQTIERFRTEHEATGAIAARRAGQAVGWFRALLDLAIAARLFQNNDDQKALKDLEKQVHDGEITPDRAVDSLLARIGL